MNPPFSKESLRPLLPLGLLTTTASAPPLSSYAHTHTHPYPSFPPANYIRLEATLPLNHHGSIYPGTGEKALNYLYKTNRRYDKLENILYIHLPRTLHSLYLSSRLYKHCLYLIHCDLSNQYRYCPISITPILCRFDSKPDPKGDLALLVYSNSRFRSILLPLAFTPSCPLIQALDQARPLSRRSSRTSSPCTSRYSHRPAPLNGHAMSVSTDAHLMHITRRGRPWCKVGDRGVSLGLLCCADT